MLSTKTIPTDALRRDRLRTKMFRTASLQLVTRIHTANLVTGNIFCFSV